MSLTRSTEYLSNEPYPHDYSRNIRPSTDFELTTAWRQSVDSDLNLDLRESQEVYGSERDLPERVRRPMKRRSARRKEKEDKRYGREYQNRSPVYKERSHSPHLPVEDPVGDGEAFDLQWADMDGETSSNVVRPRIVSSPDRQAVDWGGEDRQRRDSTSSTESGTCRRLKLKLRGVELNGGSGESAEYLHKLKEQIKQQKLRKENQVEHDPVNEYASNPHFLSGPIDEMPLRGKPLPRKVSEGHEAHGYKGFSVIGSRSANATPLGPLSNHNHVDTEPPGVRARSDSRNSEPNRRRVTGTLGHHDSTSSLANGGSGRRSDLISTSDWRKGRELIRRELGVGKTPTTGAVDSVKQNGTAHPSKPAIYQQHTTKDAEKDTVTKESQPTKPDSPAKKRKTMPKSAPEKPEMEPNQPSSPTKNAKARHYDVKQIRTYLMAQREARKRRRQEEAEENKKKQDKLKKQLAALRQKQLETASAPPVPPHGLLAKHAESTETRKNGPVESSSSYPRPPLANLDFSAILETPSGEVRTPGDRVTAATPCGTSTPMNMSTVQPPDVPVDSNVSNSSRAHPGVARDARIAPSNGPGGLSPLKFHEVWPGSAAPTSNGLRVMALQHSAMTLTSRLAEMMATGPDDEECPILPPPPVFQTRTQPPVLRMSLQSLGSSTDELAQVYMQHRLQESVPYQNNNEKERPGSSSQNGRIVHVRRDANHTGGTSDGNESATDSESTASLDRVPPPSQYARLQEAGNRDGKKRKVIFADEVVPGHRTAWTSESQPQMRGRRLKAPSRDAEEPCDMECDSPSEHSEPKETYDFFAKAKTRLRMKEQAEEAIQPQVRLPARSAPKHRLMNGGVAAEKPVEKKVHRPVAVLQPLAKDPFRFLSTYKKMKKYSTGQPDESTTHGTRVRPELGRSTSKEYGGDTFTSLSSDEDIQTRDTKKLRSSTERTLSERDLHLEGLASGRRSQEEAVYEDDFEDMGPASGRPETGASTGRSGDSRSSGQGTEKSSGSGEKKPSTVVEESSEMETTSDSTDLPKEIFTRDHHRTVGAGLPSTSTAHATVQAVEGRLSPRSLELKLLTELQFLESMETSLEQVNDVERLRAVSLAQQETVSLAQVLKARETTQTQEIQAALIAAQREFQVGQTSDMDEVRRRTLEAAQNFAQNKSRGRGSYDGESEESTLILETPEGTPYKDEEASSLAESSQVSQTGTTTTVDTELEMEEEEWTPRQKPSRRPQNKEANTDDDLSSVMSDEVVFGSPRQRQKAEEEESSVLDSSRAEEMRKKLKKMPLDRKLLTTREQKLHRRRQQAEDLLKWKQALDEEEKKVRRLEKQAMLAYEEKQKEARDNRAHASHLKQRQPEASRKPTGPKQQTVEPKSAEISSRVSKASSSAGDSEEMPRKLKLDGESEGSISEDLSGSGVESLTTPRARKRGSDGSLSSIKDEIEEEGSVSSSTIQENVNTDRSDQTKDRSLASIPTETTSPREDPSYRDSFETPSTTSTSEQIDKRTRRRVASATSSSRTNQDDSKSGTSSKRTLSSSRQRPNGSSPSDEEDSVSNGLSETMVEVRGLETRIERLREEVRLRRITAEDLKKKQRRVRRERLVKKEEALQSYIEMYDKHNAQLEAELIAEEARAAANLDATDPDIRPLSMVESPSPAVRPKIKGTSGSKERDAMGSLILVVERRGREVEEKNGRTASSSSQASPRYSQDDFASTSTIASPRSNGTALESVATEMDEVLTEKTTPRTPRDSKHISFAQINEEYSDTETSDVEVGTPKGSLKSVSGVHEEEAVDKKPSLKSEEDSLALPKLELKKPEVRVDEKEKEEDIQPPHFEEGGDRIPLSARTIHSEMSDIPEDFDVEERDVEDNSYSDDFTSKRGESPRESRCVLSGGDSVSEPVSYEPTPRSSSRASSVSSESRDGETTPKLSPRESKSPRLEPQISQGDIVEELDEVVESNESEEGPVLDLSLTTGVEKETVEDVVEIVADVRDQVEVRDESREVAADGKVGSNQGDKITDYLFGYLLEDTFSSTRGLASEQKVSEVDDKGLEISGMREAELELPQNGHEDVEIAQRYDSVDSMDEQGLDVGMSPSRDSGVTMEESSSLDGAHREQSTDDDWMDDDLGFPGLRPAPQRKEQAKPGAKLEAAYRESERPGASQEENSELGDYDISRFRDQLEMLVVVSPEEVMPRLERAVSHLWEGRQAADQPGLGLVEAARVPPVEFTEEGGLDVEGRTPDLLDLVFSPNVTTRTVDKGLLFDLAVEVVADVYEGENRVPQPWMDQSSLLTKPKYRLWRGSEPPNDLSKLTSIVTEEVCPLLGLPALGAALRQKRPSKLAQWTAKKKKDRVDEILVEELREEERGWVNYEEDAVTVKNQITQGIFDDLLKESVQEMMRIYSGKYSSGVQEIAL